jgi:hypothetical protein
MRRAADDATGRTPEQPGLDDSVDLFAFDDAPAQPELDGDAARQVEALIDALDDTAPAAGGEAIDTPGADDLGGIPKEVARHAMLGLGAIAFLALLNAVAVIVMWKNGTDLESRLTEMDERVERASTETHVESAPPAPLDAPEKPEAGETHAAPTSAESAAADTRPDHDYAELFLAVESDLERGDAALARERLYALLSVADRLDPGPRREAEARCQYLLADAFKREAMASAPEAH